MKTTFARLKEPSTWTAIGGLFAAFGLSVEPGTWEQIGAGIAAVSALAAGIALPEGKGNSQ